MSKVTNKRLQRLLSILLVLVMMMQLSPVSSFATGEEQSDSNFEGFAKWTVADGKIDVTDGVSGNGALITAEKTAVLSSQAFSVTEGGKYRIGISAKCLSGTATLSIHYYTDSAASKTLKSQTVAEQNNATTDFKELSGDITVPAGAKAARLELLVTEGSCVADDAYVREYSTMPEIQGIIQDQTGNIGRWSQFYPTGVAEGDWTAQKDKAADPNSYNYAYIVKDGCDDEGAVRFVRADVYEHIGIGIGAELVIGERYTVKMNVRGQTGASWGGLQLYAHNDPVVALFGPEGNYPNADTWYEVSMDITATRNHLYLFANGGAYACDITVDNIQVLDSQGNDMLNGYGNFTGNDSLTLGKNNRIENGDFEDVSFGYLPLEEYNATFEGVSEEDFYQWYLNDGSNDKLSISVDDNSKHLLVQKVDNESVLYGPEVQIAAGKVYQMCLDVRTSAQTAIGGYWIDASGNVLEFWDSALLIDSENWYNVAEVITAPEEAVAFQPCLLFVGSSADTLEIDNVALHPCSDAPSTGTLIPGGLANEPFAGSFSGAPAETWVPFFPAGTPDSGTWAAWSNNSHYAEVVDDGHNEIGSLHIKSNSGRNAGVAINAGMTAGEKYTLGFWAKGTSNSGKVLALYANGDAVVIGGAENLTADWSYYELTFTAGMSQLNIFASDWGVTNIYIDNITLKNSTGTDLLAGRGDFYTVTEGTEPSEPEEMTKIPGGLANEPFAGSFSGAPAETWVPFFPAGTPDSGTWAAWSNNSHYAEVVDDGHNEIGSLHIKSNNYKNAGVAINAGMTVGQRYTLGFWAKGTSNSGKVLALYANGDPVVIGGAANLTADWSYYELTFTAGISQLNIFASDWGVTDIYIDNITLKNSTGTDLLAGRGDFYTVTEGTEPSEPEEMTKIPGGLANEPFAGSFSGAPAETWVPFFPAGTPDSGTWAAWSNNSHYAEVVDDGHNEIGSLHIKSNSGRNAGVAINAGMTAGEKYTLGFWAKGTSNSGKVLALYANGDAVVIGGAEKLTGDWSYYELTFTANISQLNILASDWGVTNIYIDNITLKNSAGVDLLKGKGDFYVEEAVSTAQRFKKDTVRNNYYTDESVNLIENGDFENTVTLSIPGWIVEGAGTMAQNGITLRSGAMIRSLRYDVEPGQIFFGQYTALGGKMTVEMGSKDTVISYVVIPEEGKLFSVPNNADWIRVRFAATDDIASVTALELIDKGDPANLDFELKNPDSDMPMNWNAWTAVNLEEVRDIASNAYTVSQQEGTGLDNSASLYIKQNVAIPQNANTGALSIVVDSIQIKVNPNTTYSFSWYSKLLAENAFAYPQVRCFKEDGSPDGATIWMTGGQNTDGSGQWRNLKTSFSTGSETAYISFRLEFKASNAGAQFWIDRITYSELGSALDANLDMELGEEGMLPLNWTAYERNVKTGVEGIFGSYNATWTKNSGNGTAALKVTKLNSEGTQMYLSSKKIDVQPNTAYYFSYDAATLNVKTSDTIQVMLKMCTANGNSVSNSSKAFYWPTSAYATGLYNWSKFGAIFETPSDCATVQILLCVTNSNGGTTYIDNVSLTPTIKLEDPNFDFEYSVGTIPLNWEHNGVLANSVMSIYDENVYSGNQAVRIHRQNGEVDGSYLYAQKLVPVSAGDKIEVVAHTASRNSISGNMSLCLYGFSENTTDGSKMVSATYGQARTTNATDEWSPWDTYEILWTVPKGVEYIQVVIRVYGNNADVLVDDIVFYNYTESENLIYSEDFKNPSAITGLPGGWEKGEITGSGEAKINGQLSLTGNENSDVEIFTKLYSLVTDNVYELTSDVFTTGSAEGELVMEAVNWDGSVVGQPVVLALNTGGTNQTVKANFTSPSASYYRLYLRKTGGNGSVCVENIFLRQTGVATEGITWAGYWLSHPDETFRLADAPHPFTDRHYYYRHEINLDKPVETAQMQITADDKFTLYINGQMVYEESRSGDTWDMPTTVDITDYLTEGTNVIAVDLYNNIYLYGLLFDGIVTMEGDSTLRFYSCNDTMVAAQCYSNQIEPTVNSKWTEFDDNNWFQTDYDISQCDLWLNADQYCVAGGGAWNNIDFDPTEYSDAKIESNEFIFPDEVIVAGDSAIVTATLKLEKPLAETNTFGVNFWKKNTVSKIATGTMTLVGEKTTADWPVGEEFTAEFQLQIPLFLAEGSYTVQFDNMVSIVSDYFINNKVGSVKVVQIERELTTTSSVEVVNGKATMIVNGEAQAPLWYARCEGRAPGETITKLGEVGVNTVVTYVFLNNNYGDVWTKEGFASDAIDAMMLETLAGNPEAQLVVALDFNVPDWWKEENPGELAALSETKVSKTGVSFASEKWKQEAGAIMVEAVNYMMQQPYANNIIGFKTTGGFTLEWNWWATSESYVDVGDFSECGINAFRAWLTEKYGTDEALQAAWGDSSVTLAEVLPPMVERRADDYLDTVKTIQNYPDAYDYELYMADLKADTIEYFAALIKDAIDDRLIVGTYGGYFTGSGGYMFTTAVANVYFQRMLQSENIDFIKSPWTYTMREIGDSSQFMGPVDSLDLYGKLWIIEEDDRLNLREMSGSQDGNAGVGWTRYYQQSVEQLKRNFSYVLSKGMGMSFYELMWDFFEDEQYYSLIGAMYQEMTLSLGLENESVAELAVFYDGESQMVIPHYWDGRNELNEQLSYCTVQGQLKEFGHIGADYDLYLLDDLADGLVPEHKVYLFLATHLIDAEERAAIEKLKANGNILIFIFTDGICDGENTDLSLIEDLTEMNLKYVSTQRKQIATAQIINSSHWLTEGTWEGLPYGPNTYDKLSPIIGIEDSSVTPLAYHSTTSTVDGTPAGQVALGVKEQNDYTIIYSAMTNLPHWLIRNAMEKAGCHSYTESGSDVIYANNNYVAIHSNFAGERAIDLPDTYTVYDVFNRETVATNVDSFEVTLSNKETRLFRLTKTTDMQVYIGQNAGGTVTNKGLNNVACGDSLTFQFQADEGYRLSYLLVDGQKLIPNGDSYTIENIQESHTVIARFAESWADDAGEQPITNQEQPANNRLGFVLIGGSIGLLVLIAAAIVIVFVSKKKKKQV